jgi:hypothetical protein
MAVGAAPTDAVATRLPSAQARLIHAAAGQRGVTVAALLRELLEAPLADLHGA